MKGIVRNIVFIVAAAALCLMLPACGSGASGPAQTVDAALKAITTHDYEALKDYYAGNVDELAQDATELGGQQGLGDLSASSDNLTDEQKQRMTAALNKLLEFDYTVGQENIDGDTATVDVTFTNYDIGSAAKTFLQSALAAAFTQAFSEPADESAATDALLDNLEATVDQLGEKNVTKEAQVKLVKAEDGTWKLASFEGDEEYSRQLVNAMFGGLVDSLQSWAEDLSSAFGGMGASGH